MRAPKLQARANYCSRPPWDGDKVTLLRQQKGSYEEAVPTSEDELKAWMIAGLAGDADAHGALLRAVTPLLRAFYRRRLGQEEAVEDLVQETLIAVHTRRLSYDRSRPFSPWLYAIARYKMVDHFRRARSRPAQVEGDPACQATETEDAINARLDLDHLLATLPERQASLIRGMHLEGHTAADMAHSRGIGESAAKVSVHRALKALALRFRRSPQ